MKKIRLAILAGGWSGEREVSQGSGRAVYDALDRNRYEITFYDPKEHLLSLIENKDAIDLAFILLHGKMGEDGCLQGFLELLSIPYVGSGVLSSALAMNKKLAKEVYRSVGLQVPAQVILKRGEEIRPRFYREYLGEKVVVKPVSEGSSLGISICSSEVDLRIGIGKALLLDEEVMLEEHVAGREITCGVLGNAELETLPLIEIAPNPPYDFFDYEAKYTSGATREICPADLDETVAEKIREFAKLAHQALQCRVWSRTDTIIRGDEIFLLETNTIPGMTQNSLFPLAARTAGLSMAELVERLIQLSLEKTDPECVRSRKRADA
ncbi:MAG: D-alanine--D-alanine ligase [Desulfatiglandaceae bacterium]|jgi:D-alanine-D-alanine ligase